MAQLRPSVLYTLLFLGAVLASSALIIGVFYDSEKFEGNRYQNSYAEFDDRHLTEQQKTAISILKKRGVEWAHFRFIEAAKNGDIELVRAFIGAGMPLNSSTVLLEIALSDISNKREMLSLLIKNYHLDVQALYRLPNYVTQFDTQLAAVYAPYIEKKKEAFRIAMLEYKKALASWEQAFEKKKQQMLSACMDDVCRHGRINDTRLLFANSEPDKPELEYISKSRVFVSLQTVFAWQKDQELMAFIDQQKRERIPNKLFLTDNKLIYFVVDDRGNSSIINIK